jgi:hypothetical protein
MNKTKAIHLNEPNTLASFLTEEERQTIVSLKITGSIGLKDFDVLDDMCTAWGEYDEYDNFTPNYEESPALRVLDMGEAAFVDGDCIPDFGFHALLETLILPYNTQKVGVHIDSGLCESDSLQNLILPKGLKVVGGFMNCPRLTNLILPEGLEEIQHFAFGSCESITNIRIPASVKSMDGSSFCACSIAAFGMDSTNPYYTTIDGVVFSRDLKTLVAFPSAYPHTDYKIPDTTSFIAPNAFADARIENIEFPDGLSAIGNWAFDGSMVKSICLPNSVTTIGQGAFRSCLQLENIQLSSKLEELPTQLFSGCPKLKKVNVPSSVRKLYYSAVAWTFGLEQLILNDGLEEIVDEGPMLGCGGKLQDITFPKTLKKVSGGLFNYNPLIKSYKLDPGNPNFCVINGALYSKDGKTLYAVPDPERTYFEIPEGVEIIAKRAFAFLPNLKEIVLPSTLRVIGTRAFQGVKSLEKIVIPKSVLEMDVCAFLSCDRLLSVTMESSTPPKMTGYVKDDEWQFNNIILQVPQHSSEAYKNALGWKCFVVKENNKQKTH